MRRGAARGGHIPAPSERRAAQFSAGLARSFFARSESRRSEAPCAPSCRLRGSVVGLQEARRTAGVGLATSSAM